MTLFRKIAPVFTLLLCLTSLYSLAQKKDWSFTDRTGIKGLQFSVGGQRFADPLFFKHALQKFVTEIPGDTVHLLYDKDYRALPSFRLQLVYAPFRFSSNTFLRNVELIGGIYSQSQVVKYISLISGGENTDTSGIYNYKDYKLDERFGAATLSMQFNFPVFDKVMVYGSLGGGWGIFNGLRMESKGMNQRIFQDDSINNKTIVTDIQTEAPKVFYQSTSSWQSNFLIGAKVYLTCRINLYAEYGYQSIFFLPKGHQSYHQNGQTLHFGIRFKFNPPDKSTPEKQEPKQGAFW